MSVSTMPTWWADRRQSPTVIPWLREKPRAVRGLRGLGVLAAVLAVSAIATAFPMSTHQTPLAARTLAAEHVQNLAAFWQQKQDAQPEYRPPLYSMLPVTARAGAQACEPGC